MAENRSTQTMHGDRANAQPRTPAQLTSPPAAAGKGNTIVLRLLRRPILIAPVALLCVASGAAVVAQPNLDQLRLTSSHPGPLGIGVDQAEYVVDSNGQPVTLTLDGKRIASSDGGVLRHTLSGLAEGKYKLVAEIDRGFPRGNTSVSHDVVVDTTAPKIRLNPIEPVGIKEPVTVTGTVEGAVRISSAGKQVKISDNGTFSLRYDTPPTGQDLVAVDSAGNQTNLSVNVPVIHPGMRAVHVTSLGWTSRAIKDPIFQLAREGKIDTIQIDLKDETGIIGYDTTVPTARQIGAIRARWDLRKAVAEIHEADLRVVGRIVAFKDPILGNWASANGKTDMIVQNPDGSPYMGGNGGLMNFAHPDVRAYNIDLAVEAAKAGVDDILWDYVRRPDGKETNLKFAGLKGTPEQGIAAFVAEGSKALRPMGAYVGATVYGIAADRPTQIAQDIPMLAQHVDFIAPMVYPSTWTRGEHGVADPYRMPAEIVTKALTLFKLRVEGTSTKVMPWLQDYYYQPEQVQAQIDAAARLGIDSWLLWNPGARYTADALKPVRTNN